MSSNRLPQQASLSPETRPWVQALLDQSLAGIYLIQDGYFKYVNQEFAHIFGYPSPESLIEQVHVSALIAPEDQQKVADNIRRRTEGAVPEMRYTFTGVRLDGRKIEVEVNGRSMAFEGRPAVIGVLLDVSARTQAERAKQDFLNVVSHEFRTPLHQINAVLHMLRKQRLDEQGGRLIDTLDATAHRLQGLVEAILEYMDIDNAAARSVRSLFDPHALVEQAATLARDQLAGRPVVLVTAFADEVPGRLRGDAAGIRKVLDCLLSNAVKFSERGNLMVSTSMTRDREGLPSLEIAVQDEGCGIPVERQSQLFRPLSQGDESATRTHGGLGLGLALSRRIVEAAGGEIGFTSAPGQGSRFWFHMPVQA